MEIKPTEEISVMDYTKVAGKNWVAVDDVLPDIKAMLLLIRAFTKSLTEGEDLLEEWESKYLTDSTQKTKGD